MSAVDLFVRYLHTEKRFSPHTLRAYQTDLEQFRKFVEMSGTGGELFLVSPKMIRSWIISLADEGHGSKSINRKVISLRRFFRFCQAEGYVGNNPAELIQGLKTKKTLPVFIEEDPMSDLRTLMAEQATGFPGVRDLIIIELLYGTGMRRAEVIRLEDHHLDLRQGTIKVLGKREKERIIPLPDPLITDLDSYLTMRDEQFGLSRYPALILTNKGTPVYPKFVYRIVHHWLTVVSSVTKRSPHVLRHTYATHLLNHGADLNAIKELLGHTSLNATQVYTHTGVEKLKQVYIKAHPRARTHK